MGKVLQKTLSIRGRSALAVDLGIALECQSIVEDVQMRPDLLLRQRRQSSLRKRKQSSGSAWMCTEKKS